MIDIRRTEMNAYFLVMNSKRYTTTNTTTVCNDKNVEDELHLLCDCTFYNEFRYIFLQKVATVVNFDPID